MWSRNLGAICAHSVAGALTSKLSVSNDPLETSWECNFHYPLSFSVQCDGYIFCAALSLVSFNVVSDNALLTKMVPRQWIDASSSWKCRKDLFWFSVVKKRVNVLLKHCLFITIRHYVFNWCPWHSLCFSCIQVPNQELATFMQINILPATTTQFWIFCGMSLCASFHIKTNLVPRERKHKKRMHKMMNSCRMHRIMTSDCSPYSPGEKKDTCKYVQDNSQQAYFDTIIPARLSR